jgi:hypothetical protein
VVRVPDYRTEIYTISCKVQAEFIYVMYKKVDCLSGIVVRVFGYRSRGPGFDSLRCQIFCEVVGLEMGTLSLVSTIEELLGRNSSGSGLEIREYGHRDLSY